MYRAIMKDCPDNVYVARPMATEDTDRKVCGAFGVASYTNFVPGDLHMIASENLVALFKILQET